MVCAGRLPDLVQVDGVWVLQSDDSRADSRNAQDVPGQNRIGRTKEKESGRVRGRDPNLLVNYLSFKSTNS